LLPGSYQVDAEKSGFKKITVKEIVVAVNETIRVDLTLPVGDLADAVNVAAEAPLIQTDQGTLGQVVNDRVAHLEVGPDTSKPASIRPCGMANAAWTANAIGPTKRGDRLLARTGNPDG
jgi:hypothetical protein